MTSFPSDRVAELEGFYGSLHIAERFLQEIWEKQDFSTDRLFLQDGRALVVLSPGVWNHQEGPDFRDATLRIHSATVQGDVELHLYPRDWDRHGHSADPNYRHVVLHVSLFDGPVATTLPQQVPMLSLLPFLQSDLEGMLTQYALRQTLAVDPREEPWVQRLLGRSPPPEQVHGKLVQHAMRRWDVKRHFAQLRLERYGWRESCHQGLLEVLGYRRNRAPMHAIALEHPLGSGLPDWQPEQVFEAHRSHWKLQGIRPCNQPFRRLCAYHALLSKQPDWPDRLLQTLGLLRDVPEAQEELVSEPNRLKQWRRDLGVLKVLHDAVPLLRGENLGESRMHTAFCDAFLPLFAAHSGRDAFAHWALWPPGDRPAFLDQVAALACLLSMRGSVRCNAWMQGMLQLAIETD